MDPAAAASDSRNLPVRKAVIPVAGLGTRLLPITKAVPKGMLPVIDRPVVQYVVEEAAAAGLTDLVLVTGQDSEAFIRYFEPADELERVLTERGDHETAAMVRAATGDTSIGFLTQSAPRGLGDAVLRCADYVGNEPFAILFGDNILGQDNDLLSTMIATRERYGGTVLALIEIPPDEVSSRAVALFEPTDDPGIVRVTDLIEKPDVSKVPSNSIMIGRCVCDPAVFGVLEHTPPGYSGEIQLSDALRTLARADPATGGGVHGLLFQGRRFDTGNKQDYLRTMVEMACSRPDVADQFLPWLRHYLGSAD
jgi:UTP--glucose-1-phosphate uridylyltransferase